MMKFQYREALTPGTICILIFPKTEIARSVNGPRLQGLHAEDAMAKRYLELSTSVT